MKWYSKYLQVYEKSLDETSNDIICAVKINSKNAIMSLHWYLSYLLHTMKNVI